MNLVTIAFYFFVLTAALSAIAILLSKNVFKAALCLLICLLSIAAIYILAFAEFVAITQILIYAGGILVVIIFGIMLTSKMSGKPLKVTSTNIFSGLLASIVLLALLINFISGYPTPAVQGSIQTSGSIETIGINFMTVFALPFEIAGILLMVALLGAAVITSFMKSKKL
jgi:NADH:ubiquinone oxidoreductase subunit 6 (subunit J)